MRWRGLDLVHVVDGSVWPEDPTLGALVSHGGAAGWRQGVVSVDGGLAGRLSRALGMSVGLASCRLGWPMTAGRGLRRVVSGGRPGVVHAWGLLAGMAALWAWPGVRLVLTLSDCPGGRWGGRDRKSAV